MKYIVFGIPGVGKTSVISSVVEKTAIKHIHWGDLSKEVATKKGLIHDVDELRRLDLNTQIEVKKEVVQEIINSANSGSDVLIETHAAIKTPQGFMPGLDLRTIKALDPDVFVVIESSPELVFQRRLLDESRVRKDDLTIDDVKESLRVTRQMAMTYSVLASGTVVFVDNKEGDVDYAVNKIVELIELGRVSEDDIFGAI